MEKEKRSLFQRFLLWREKNIKEKQFILILSFLVGIFTAITALILKMLIHWIQNFLTNNFNTTEANYLYLVYPVVGRMTSVMELQKSFMPFPVGKDGLSGTIHGRL